MVTPMCVLVTDSAVAHSGGWGHCIVTRYRLLSTALFWRVGAVPNILTQTRQISEGGGFTNLGPWSFLRLSAPGREDFGKLESN